MAGLGLGPADFELFEIDDPEERAAAVDAVQSATLVELLPVFSVQCAEDAALQQIILARETECHARWRCMHGNGDQAVGETIGRVEDRAITGSPANEFDVTPV